jgi:hypothetical protein
VIGSADRRRAVFTESKHSSAVCPSVSVLNARAACAGTRAEGNSAAGVWCQEHCANALRTIVDQKNSLAESRVVTPASKRQTLPRSSVLVPLTEDVFAGHRCGRSRGNY